MEYVQAGNGAASGLDDRRLRDGGCKGGLRSVADRRLPRSGRDRTARRPASAFRAFAGAPRGDWAQAGVTKDAGDDPDVTHGALVIATVRLGAPGEGIVFRAGEGVGTVTRPGLPLPPGEPAINPAPRAMIRAALESSAARLNGPRDVVVEISIPDGAKIAERTLNGRLGISAACRFSARPASSCRSPARPGSTRSIAASTSRAPRD